MGVGTMKIWIVAVALAGAAWGCDAKAATNAAAVQDAKSGLAYTATVKIDDV